MAQTSPARRRPGPDEATENIVLNGVVLAELAIGLFWGAFAWLYVARHHPNITGDWHGTARLAFWLVGLVAIMAADLFFRVLGEPEETMAYRMFRSLRGGVLATMPIWLVCIVLLALGLVMATGAKPEPQSEAIEKPTTSEPTAVPADR